MHDKGKEDGQPTPLIEEKPDEEVDTLNQESKLTQPSGDDSSSEHTQIVQCSFPCVPPNFSRPGHPYYESHGHTGSKKTRSKPKPTVVYKEVGTLVSAENWRWQL